MNDIQRKSMELFSETLLDYAKWYNRCEIKRKHEEEKRDLMERYHTLYFEHRFKICALFVFLYLVFACKFFRGFIYCLWASLNPLASVTCATSRTRTIFILMKC